MGIVETGMAYLPSRILSVLGLIGLLAGCQTAPMPVFTLVPPLPSARIVHDYTAGLTQTWQAVVDVVNARSLPIITLDQSSGVIVTDFIRADNDRAIFPKESDHEINVLGRYRLNILVVRVGAYSRVRINTHFERISTTNIPAPLSPDIPVTEPTWREQHSTGALEAQLFDSIAAALKP
jgi:NlpB/DapX lipoprotein